MEIPTLSEEEKWEMMREIFVLNKQVDIGFIMQMGPEKMSEYSEMTSQQYATMLQAQGKDNAIGFALSEAIVRKNLMGSDVEVEGNPNEATLNLKRDGFLMTAMKLREKGQMPMSKEEFQHGCIEGYFKPRAEKLGLELDVEYTDKGYKIKISKK
jgi:chromosome condensin MukBEF MukE localization factor